jgi:hypothetical protein
VRPRQPEPRIGVAGELEDHRRAAEAGEGLAAHLEAGHADIVEAAAGDPATISSTTPR